MSIILFEPWALGDAVIAASVGVHIPGGCFLACHSRWHGLIRAIFADSQNLTLLPLDLPYTTRGGVRFLKSISQQPAIILHPPLDNISLISVRGDPRDLLVARKIFPHARFKVSGVLKFLARQSRFIDLLFSSGILKVTNRYESWAKGAKVDFSKLKNRFDALAKERPTGEEVAIHIGAQWQARQYPFVKELVAALKKEHRKVRILAGPHDPLPPGISAEEIDIVLDQQLIDALRQSKFAIVNDSGPMHLAAALGVKSFCLARISNIAEWLPVGVEPICSPLMPKGCLVDKKIYRGDAIVTGWPSPAEILAKISKSQTD